MLCFDRLLRFLPQPACSPLIKPSRETQQNISKAATHTYKTKNVRKERRVGKSGQYEYFGRVVGGFKPRHMLVW